MWKFPASVANSTHYHSIYKVSIWSLTSELISKLTGPSASADLSLSDFFSVSAAAPDGVDLSAAESDLVSDAESFSPSLPFLSPSLVLPFC